MTRNTVVVLGAGASRSVSYARQGGNLSPLDSDFFDLLRRLQHLESNQEQARQWILEALPSIAEGQRRSLERAFYTLHLRALMAAKLKVHVGYSIEDVVLRFVTSIDATLRAAHGTKTCDNHVAMFNALARSDAILTFNYDLVAERALRSSVGQPQDVFDPKIYGFASDGNYGGPVLLKLHGSSNWILDKSEFQVRTKTWSAFDDSPNYRAALGGNGTKFAVFLPFWEKRVEAKPWLLLWKRAFSALKHVDRLIVWGYSLPPTDVRTELLFELGVGKRSIDLCLIDPSEQTRARWRALIPAARLWQYGHILEYLTDGPEWGTSPS
jgi:hypothetical protein